MPADIEVHRGTDGKYYMLDFARLWPPEVPTQGLQASFLIRKMRPELVRSFPKPLCSDAFSSFQSGRKVDRDESNREVFDAFIFLMKELIPSFTRHLESTITDPLAIRNFRLTPAMHEKGNHPPFFIESLIAHSLFHFSRNQHATLGSVVGDLPE